MSEDHPLPRHRRTNPKRKRDEIYSYEAFEKPQNEDDDSEQEPPEEISDDYEDDDSFTYGVGRVKKGDSKRKKLKSKIANKGEKPARNRKS